MAGYEFASVSVPSAILKRENLLSRLWAIRDATEREFREIQFIATFANLDRRFFFTSVVLVDSDVQGSSSVWLHEAEPDISVFRLQSPDEVLEQVPRLREKFDHVVIDGPAGLSEVMRTILFVSDVTFVPCGPSVLDLRAAHDAIRVIHQVKRIRDGFPISVLVPNKLQVRYRLSREFVETAKTLGLPVTTGLRLRQPYADAAGQGTVVWWREKNRRTK